MGGVGLHPSQGCCWASLHGRALRENTEEAVGFSGCSLGDGRNVAPQSQTPVPLPPLEL